MSEHKVNQPEPDASAAGDEISTDQRGNSGSDLLSTATPLQSPHSPHPQNPAPKEKSDWHKILTLTFEGLGLAALIVYTVFSILQWAQIRWTNRLTREALNDNGNSLQATLGKMQGQIDATTKLYSEAQKQTEQVGKQARASERAATTADQSLHVSERAYIISGFPTLNEGGNNIAIPVLDVGRIPSGKVTAVVHEATINVPGPDAPVAKFIPVETHWKSYTIEAISPNGVTFEINFPLPAGDMQKLNTGYQQVVVVGAISYNDGFPSDPESRWPFCYATLFYPNIHKLTWITCDSSMYLDELIQSDHYPNNEYK